VICKEGLVLIIKQNGTPACVKQNTVIILVLRDWTSEIKRSFYIALTTQEVCELHGGKYNVCPPCVGPGIACEPCFEYCTID